MPVPEKANFEILGLGLWWKIREINYIHNICYKLSCVYVKTSVKSVHLVMQRRGPFLIWRKIKWLSEKSYLIQFIFSPLQKDSWKQYFHLAVDFTNYFFIERKYLVFPHFASKSVTMWKFREIKFLQKNLSLNCNLTKKVFCFFSENFVKPLKPVYISQCGNDEKFAITIFCKYLAKIPSNQGKNLLMHNLLYKTTLGECKYWIFAWFCVEIHLL